ncbi:MAG TPA: glycosyltransferase [Chthoniobacteraceae bacterium]|jgi:glycosyltransferase involved in cell wall biosynthesis
MNLHFFEPPAEERIGGLEAAIVSLRESLRNKGVKVDSSFPEAAGDEVVHFHGLWQIEHARLGRKCAARGIPYVVSPHGMLEPWAWRHKWWKKWPYFQLIEKRYLAGAAALLATAPMEARRLAKFAPKQRIETLPLGLTGTARPDYRTARQQLGWAPEEVVLLFLSRLHIKKGPDLLLKALSSMKWPRVARLVFVGEGDPGYVDSLKQFATDHAASLPRIDWLGAVWGEARWKYFQAADLFCLPTHSENFGLAVLEACQVGTPTLTTVETPWAEELTDGRGYIASPRVESVRDALAQYFSAPRRTSEQRAALADWAQERYGWDHLADRYLEFYSSLLKPNPTV